MVLEQIVKLQWIERKEHSFFLGLIYAFVGIISAYLILPSYAGIMSIAFTSILLIPSLNKLLAEEENVEIREKKLSPYLLFKDHFDIIKVYFFLFFGIFTTYLILAVLMGKENVASLFSAQLNLTGAVGSATKAQFFWDIVINNAIVFAACFLLSFFYGAGSILLLTINASTWGVFFGYTFNSAMAKSGFLGFFYLLLPVLPHTMTEALSYVFAAIVGGIVSKAVLREDLFSEKFNHIVTDALILLGIGLVLVTIGAAIEVYIF